MHEGRWPRIAENYNPRRKTKANAGNKIVRPMEECHWLISDYKKIEYLLAILWLLCIQLTELMLHRSSFIAEFFAVTESDAHHCLNQHSVKT
jgi:hypothetical protein